MVSGSKAATELSQAITRPSFGMAGGLTAAGGLVLAFVSLKDEIFGKGDFDLKSIDPTTMAITAGGALIAVAGPANATTGSRLGTKAITGIQSGGAILAMAGVGALLTRPVGRLVGHDPIIPEPDPNIDPQYGIEPFTKAAVSDTRQLAGVHVAIGRVMSTDGTPMRPKVYLDVTTSKDLPAGTSVERAIAEARVRTQQDRTPPLYRAHAVVRTTDGTLHTIRLEGEFDQVDGMKYTDGNKYSDKIEPSIYTRHASLVAVVGVEGFISTSDPESSEYVPFDEIPVLTPDIPTGGPSPSGSPSPSSSPSPSPSGSPSASPSSSPTSGATP